MANKIYRKHTIDKSVMESALERINIIFDRYDHVAVSFSGGKDSTAVLNLALQVARERNRLPLLVMHFDEEAIQEPTVEYLERVRQIPDIDFRWYCLEIKHINACSRKEPDWYCWDQTKKHLWVREIPNYAITKLKGFRKGMNIPQAVDCVFSEMEGTKCSLLGIRADESVRRFRVLARKKDENWIKSNLNSVYNNINAYPIYDWTSQDVWLAPKLLGWDYNRAYDNMMMMGISPSAQRVCQPFGEEPIRGLYIYAEAYPEMWEKLLKRVHGVATAYRYANTELYSVRIEKPDDLTWQDYLYTIVELYNGIGKHKELLLKSLNILVNRHNKKSILPITEDDPDPISGISYKFLCKVALKGDFKGRSAESMAIKADQSSYRAKQKMSLQECITHFATNSYKQKFKKSQYEKGRI